MDEDGDGDVSKWLNELFSGADHDDAVQILWQRIADLGLVSKLTVHRYICAKCGPIVTVIRLGHNTFASTRDYKQSVGMSRATSVRAAREKHTLDGDRHWPGHIYDVDQLARDHLARGNFIAACRHVHTTLLAADVLAQSLMVKPGHPGAPTRLN